MMNNDLKDGKSASEDGPYELLVVKIVLFFHFKLFEQLVQLVIRQLFSEVGHHISKLLNSDGGPLGLEDGLHGLNKLVLGLRFLILTSS